MDSKTQRDAKKAAEKAQEVPREPGAEMKIPGKAEDDVLGVIAGVENQLSALRKAHAEHRAAMADLAEKRRELAELSENIKTEETLVEGRVEELESREKELSSREVELAEMRQEVESREQDVTERAGRIEQRESKITQKAEGLERLEAEIESKSEEIARDREQLNLERSTLDASLREVAERSASVDSKQNELTQLAEELGAREKEIGEKLERENEAERKLGEMKSAFDEMNARVSEQESELSSLRERADQLSGEREGLEASVREAEDRLSRERKVTEGLRAQIEVAEDEVKSVVGSVERVAELEQLLEKAQADLSEVRAGSVSEIEAAIARAESLDQELKGERERAESLGLELDAAKAALEGAANSEELDAANARVEALQGQLSEIAAAADEELTETRSKLEATEQSASEAQERAQLLEASLSEAQANLDAAVSERDELAAQTEQAAGDSEEIARLRAALEKAAEKIKAAEGDAEAATESFCEAEAKINELESEGAELRSKIKDLEELSRPVGDEITHLRRVRLQKQRKLIRVQGDKVRRATEALRDRLDQCDQVLHKRAELAEAYQGICEARERTARSEIRGGTLLGLTGFMAVLGMLAGIAWFVSGRVTPGMYEATAVLEASAGPRQALSPEDASSWQLYMEDLAGDPRFLEQAADRMRRRGITSLGTAGELGRVAKESLTVETGEPGKVRLAWRGEGSTRTERVLDTYAVALASVSNAARARRADGATTAVTEEAVSTDEPLDTARIEMAGMIFGGSTTFTLVFGGVLWRRLAAAKAKFERDSRVEPILDESDWQMPERG